VGGKSAVSKLQPRGKKNFLIWDRGTYVVDFVPGILIAFTAFERNTKMLSPRNLITLGKESFSQWWNEDRPFELAAALAYYTIFSMAPLLVIAIAVAGFVFGREAAQDQVVSTLSGFVGEEGGKAVQEAVENASKQQTSDSLFAMIGGVALLLFGAGGVVGQLQSSLNMIWGVEPKAGRGILGFLRDRFVSYAMVLGVGFLLLVSLAVTAALNAFDQFLESSVPGAGLLLKTLHFIVSLGVVSFLFAAIFKFLPDAKVSWRDVAIGALMTAILFNAGKFLIGLYIGQSSATSIYGAAGSVVTLLLWVYYSGLIFFFGAELTQVYAARFGSGVAPAGNAQPA
jgi:membrane protein